MKLYAISDLHIDHDSNRMEMENLPEYPEDWLIVAGDVCSTRSHLRFAFRVLTEKFARVIWVPGNHELWSTRSDDNRMGEAKYMDLVDICHDFGVISPEDPYVMWEGEGGPHHIVPLFLLYDYSFRPDDVEQENAVQWAVDAGVLCRDEGLLKSAPYKDKAAWCHARYAYTISRMSELADNIPQIIVNHFPLRYDLVRLPRIPRF